MKYDRCYNTFMNRCITGHHCLISSTPPWQVLVLPTSAHDSDDGLALHPSSKAALDATNGAQARDTLTSPQQWSHAQHC